MDTPADTTLAALRREFPRYQIWLEPSRQQERFIAQRQSPGNGLHTVVTTDPAELRAALTDAGGQQPAASRSGRRADAALQSSRVTGLAAAGAGSVDEGEEAECWHEVTRLRRSHPRWVIIWLAPSREFRAYRRLPGARRDTILAAATADCLAEAIRSAEEAFQRRRGRPQRP